MNTQETGMHPLEALEAAEREYVAGNYLESSRILWEATEATFAMMAKAHGLHASDTGEIAETLDSRHIGKNSGHNKHHYLSFYISGTLMRDHADMGVLEDYELAGPHRRLPEFIRNCYREFDSYDFAERPV